MGLGKVQGPAQSTQSGGAKKHRAQDAEALGSFPSHMSLGLEIEQLLLLTVCSLITETLRERQL